eukprot:TRINITY_DN6750_c0_g1_i4.p1 TRINITY_DN6750_c0_g1~~TRINITY_DN6750_c0_g1_i4.p1  ORF type:complete len:629 (+),score=138.19 TRINITY_DN6750_c0_g1_i4:166-2052(+)
MCIRDSINAEYGKGQTRDGWRKARTLQWVTAMGNSPAPEDSSSSSSDNESTDALDSLVSPFRAIGDLAELLKDTIVEPEGARPEELPGFRVHQEASNIADSFDLDFDREDRKRRAQEREEEVERQKLLRMEAEASSRFDAMMGQRDAQAAVLRRGRRVALEVLARWRNDAVVMAFFAFRDNWTHDCQLQGQRALRKEAAKKAAEGACQAAAMGGASLEQQAVAAVAAAAAACYEHGGDRDEAVALATAVVRGGTTVQQSAAAAMATVMGLPESVDKHERASLAALAAARAVLSSGSSPEAAGLFAVRASRYQDLSALEDSKDSDNRISRAVWELLSSRKKKSNQAVSGPAKQSWACRPKFAWEQPIIQSAPEVRARHTWAMCIWEVLGGSLSGLMDMLELHTPDEVLEDMMGCLDAEGVVQHGVVCCDQFVAWFVDGNTMAPSEEYVEYCHRMLVTPSHAYRHTWAVRLFKVFDTDGSGGISHDEFMDVMQNEASHDTSQQLQRALSALGPDSADREMQLEEFATWFLEETSDLDDDQFVNMVIDYELKAPSYQNNPRFGESPPSAQNMSPKSRGQPQMSPKSRGQPQMSPKSRGQPQMSPKSRGQPRAGRTPGRARPTPLPPSFDIL